MTTQPTSTAIADLICNLLCQNSILGTKDEHLEQARARGLFSFHFGGFICPYLKLGGSRRVDVDSISFVVLNVN